MKAAALWVLFVGCSGKADDEPATDTDADADTDADSDADADTDLSPVDADGDGFAAGVDCDDTDDTVFPGAPDVCGDDRVTDCDRTSDDGLVTVDGASFTDLAAALAAAPAGAEVRICPGTWVGPFSAAVPLVVAGHGGAAVTTLDGGGTGTTLALPGDSTVRGLTVTGGLTAGFGGGLAQTSAGAFTVADCVLRDNRAEIGGGLALAEGAVAVVSGTTIEANTARHGGDLYAAPGSSVELGGSTVADNVAVLSGGGVELQDASLVGGVISGNTAQTVAETGVEGAQGGGGLSAVGTCVVTDTDIGGNQAPTGGGVAVNSGSLVLVDVPIHDNLATETNGGGMWIWLSDVELAGTTEVRGNQSSNFAGGISLMGLGTLTGGLVTGNQATWFGGGLVVDDGTVIGTTITDNIGDLGGGVYGVHTVALVDVTVDGNSASFGGGLHNVFTAENALSITGGSFTSNTATWDGGAVSSYTGGTISGTRIEGNRADRGGGLFFDGPIENPSELTVTDASVVGNTANVGGGALVLEIVLRSTNSDWGADATDNVPSDIQAGENDYADYGAGASFECSDAGCD